MKELRVRSLGPSYLLSLYPFLMRIRVRVKPGAREEKVSREPDGSLRVSVKARAQEGKANEAVVKAVARFLRRAQVQRAGSSPAFPAGPRCSKSRATDARDFVSCRLAATALRSAA